MKTVVYPLSMASSPMLSQMAFDTEQERSGGVPSSSHPEAGPSTLTSVPLEKQRLKAKRQASDRQNRRGSAASSCQQCLVEARPAGEADGNRDGASLRNMPPQPPYFSTPAEASEKDSVASAPHTRPSTHPYLSGNYAPVYKELPLTPCKVVEGRIPQELVGGQYVRNGGNPSPLHMDGERAAHWFDGDGMLAGVFFQRDEGEEVKPLFTNSYILTDVYGLTPSSARKPLIPSIATLVSPSVSYISLLLQVLRAFLFYALTWLPALGLDEDEKGKRLSVANASIWYHDGKVLAGCESGPPMQIQLPRLETAGWYTAQEGGVSENDKLGGGWSTGWSALQRHFMEYTTAHPKVDAATGEMMLFHMSLVKPYLRVSVIPSSSRASSKSPSVYPQQQLLGKQVAGFSSPKLMHDFACSSTRTIMIDHPLSLDPKNLLRGKNILDYDPTRPGRFGIFPRHEPEKAQWIETSESFVVFHTANAWDDADAEDQSAGLNLLACRLNSATLIYTAGNLTPPAKALPKNNESEKCQLYYWRFSPSASSSALLLETEFPLSGIPFEFPTIKQDSLMRDASYIFGTSTRNGSFDASLKLAAKIDCLVKMNVKSLIARGRKGVEAGTLSKGDSVDGRTVEEILAQQQTQREVPDSSDISIFAMPSGWFAQEACVVPRADAKSEDDAYLVFYAFDEKSGLDPLTGSIWPNAKSELWIIDAKNMRDIVARIQLPQRVPYGLHGNFFTEGQIESQQLLKEEDLRSNKRRRPHPLVRKHSTEPLKSEEGKVRTLRGRWQNAMWAFKTYVENRIA